MSWFHGLKEKAKEKVHRHLDTTKGAPPNTTTTPVDSQQSSPIIGASVQHDSQQSTSILPVVRVKASKSTGSINIVDNLALMADVLEKVGNVVNRVPLIAPVASLLSEIVKTYKEVNDMHENRNKLLTQVTNLRSDLHGTILRMETVNYVESSGRLKADIEAYSELIDKTVALISYFDGERRVMTTVAYKQWTSKFTTLSGELSSFADRFTSQRAVDIQIQLARMENTLKESQVSSLEEKLQKWLKFPPDMSEKQHETQKLHHEGTGSWFLDGPQFSEWKYNSGCLWIKGQSGTGKTVLSSTVIRTLLNEQETVETSAVAYFYFDFRDEKKQLVEIMLRSLVLQLSAQSPHSYAALGQQYELSKKGQILPTYKNLVDVIEKLLLGFPDTFLVIDALDECKDTDLLVKLISRLQGWTKSSLHLLITSQPREIFNKTFKDVEYLVALEFETTQDDINSFVANELESKSYLEHLANRAEEITTKVVNKSNGMFRLAACLLVELSRSKLNPDLDEILADLPDDLFGIYARFLEPIGRKDFVYVTRVLYWLVFSGRPIGLLELEDALSFDFSDPHQYVYNPTKRGNIAMGVCKLLEGLVLVGGIPWVDDLFCSAHHRTTQRGKLVSMAHASVTDYILSEEFSQKHHLREDLAHTFLAQTCISYLLHFEENPLNNETFPSYPLSSYAAHYWSYHLTYSQDHPLLLMSTMHLLERGSRQNLALTQIQQSEAQELGDLSDHRIPLSLCVCSRIGYTEGVEFLLNKGDDINAIDWEHSTALQHASAAGYIDVVQLLIKSGADVNKAELSPTALQRASAEGYTDVVQLLIKSGADVNKAGGYCSALRDASAAGHTDIVCLLLQSGADVNEAKESSTALQAASLAGYTDIVNILIKSGADVNRSGDYPSALQNASAAGYTDIVDLLIKSGADVNNTGEYPRALHPASQHASAAGHTNIICLWLENVANANEPKEYPSALQRASTNGHTDIVHLLIKSGADVNKMGGYFSPLQEASAAGYTDIVCLLLKGGAHVNEAKESPSALQLASAAGHINIVDLLIKSGADVNRAGVDLSALQQASAQGHADIVQLLIKSSRLDPNKIEVSGSALWCAFIAGHIEIVHLLLQGGADVNSAGGYASLLQATSYQGHIDMVHLLLEKGADINAVGGEYGSALQAACQGDHINIVHLLLEKGTEVNGMDGKYGSALQTASQGNHKDIVCLLLDHGANVNARGVKYGSALQAASAAGHIAIVYILLDKGADVNTTGGKYGNALQAASVNGYTDIVNILLEHGAVDIEGTTIDRPAVVTIVLPNSDTESLLARSNGSNTYDPDLWSLHTDMGSSDLESFSVNSDRNSLYGNLDLELD